MVWVPHSHTSAYWWINSTRWGHSPDDHSLFHCSVLVSGHVSKTSNSEQAEQSWTKLLVLTLARVREIIKKFYALQCKIWKPPRYPISKASFQRWKKQEYISFYQTVWIISPWLWHTSCPKCICWRPQVQINVSQEKLTHSIVADGSFTALDANFNTISYQKDVKYICDFILS